MSKVIMFDLDGVLADFQTGWAKLAWDIYKVKLPPQQIWDRHGDLTKEQIHNLWDRVNQPTSQFWFDLPSLCRKKTWDRIEALCQKHVVYFVTSRKGPKAQLSTTDWLVTYGILAPSVILTSDKVNIARAVKATHVIDDRLGHAVAINVLNPHTQVFLLDKPYNQVDLDVVGSHVKRIQVLEEFLTVLEG